MKRVGLCLNLCKTSIMSIGGDTSISIDGQIIKSVNEYNFLGSYITKDGNTQQKFKKRIWLGKVAMSKLMKIMKSSDISRQCKVQSVQTIVFSLVLNGCESWTLKKVDKRKLDAFEMWTRTYISILKEIQPSSSLAAVATSRKLRYFGHLMRKEVSLEMGLFPDAEAGGKQEGQMELRQ